MWHIYDGGRDARKHPFLWQKSTLCLKKHNKEKFRWNVLRLLGLAGAGYHALAQIRENGCAAHIDVYSDTDMPPYNPMLTTYYVAGRLPYEGLFPFGTLEEIRKKYQADFITQVRVKQILQRKNHYYRRWQRAEI